MARKGPRGVASHEPRPVRYLYTGAVRAVRREVDAEILQISNAGVPGAETRWVAA